jgi:hypothetical protein
VLPTSCSYFNPSTRTALILDGEADEPVFLTFNITMERLPCRFSSVDMFDETGVKRLNITSDVVKLRVSSIDQSHVLGPDDTEEWTDELNTGAVVEHTVR